MQKLVRVLPRVLLEVVMVLLLLLVTGATCVGASADAARPGAAEGGSSVDAAVAKCRWVQVLV